MASSARTEKRNARNWYLWLWLSPLITVPSLAMLAIPAYLSADTLICGGNWRVCNYAAVERVTVAVVVVGSALWHLILLLPALAAKSEFVRWHGRQALLLAAVRTVVPLSCGLLFGTNGVCLFILILLPTYFVGNLWGQQQATRGDCTLMRRFGQEAGLPLPEPAVTLEETKEPDAEALVEIIRYSQNYEERCKAVSRLEKLGMVESL